MQEPFRSAILQVFPYCDDWRKIIKKEKIRNYQPAQCFESNSLRVWSTNLTLVATTLKNGPPSQKVYSLSRIPIITLTAGISSNLPNVKQPSTRSQWNALKGYIRIPAVLQPWCRGSRVERRRENMARMRYTSNINGSISSSSCKAAHNARENASSREKL